MKISKFLPLIGVVLFIYIIWSVGPFKILENFETANPVYFLLAIILIIPVVLVKAFKWKLLVWSYRIDYALKDCISAWLIGFFIGLITPGRIGDFAKALYLKESRNISLGKSLVTVFFDRLNDILMLFCLGVAGIFVFGLLYSIDEVFFVVMCLLFASFILFVFVVITKKIL